MTRDTGDHLLLKLILLVVMTLSAARSPATRILLPLAAVGDISPCKRSCTPVLEATVQYSSVQYVPCDAADGVPSGMDWCYGGPESAPDMKSSSFKGSLKPHI